MTDVEKRIHDAFDAQHVPEGLAERTLARIESARAEQDLEDGRPARQAEPADPRPAPKLAAVEGKAPESARVPAAGKPRPRRMRWALAAAACLLLVALGIGAGGWALLPSAYVSIDVNPSIELGVNRLGRVASTRALNDDGQQLLDAANVQGMSYEDALNALDVQLQGYISTDAVVEVTISCDEERYAALEEASRTCLGRHSSGQVHCSHATDRERAEAEECGLGLGKYRVYAALRDAGVPITPEEASDMTMRELVDLAAANGVSLHEDEAETHGRHDGSASSYAAGQAASGGGQADAAGRHRSGGHHHAEEEDR